MKKKALFTKILSFALVLSLMFSSVVPAFAQDSPAGNIRFEKVENSALKGNVVSVDKIEDSTAQTYDAEDTVRVSIFLKGDSVVEAGYSTADILDNSNALKQINKIKNNQKSAKKEIEKLIKKNLDVKQNLAIVANVISAEVQYSDIRKIASSASVEKVVVETQYMPCTGKEMAAPEMTYTTEFMTGAADAWSKGYKGAGARIAIIDTGLDIEHQSFNNDAFLHALEEDYNAAHNDNNNGGGIIGAIVSVVKTIVKGIISLFKGIFGGNSQPQETTIDKAIKEYNLLGASEIAKALPYLSAYEKANGNLTAEDLVISNKIPFAFNYVDNNLNVIHANDVQGEHGSHVSGIATANRYINVNGQYVDAMSEVGVVGNAPDAQIIVMKVFGQNGGAFDSDYMVAIEDAILLGCDSVNLSLGGGYAGASTSDSYQEILDMLATTDTVVVMSAGNSYYWSLMTYQGKLYSDSLNYATSGSPSSFNNAFSVASVNNIASYEPLFNINGTYYSYTESASYGNAPINTLANGESTDYEYVFINGIGAEEDYEGIDVNGKIVFVSRGTTSFYEKANIAVEHGAVATIIYNNQDGTIGLNLTGYEYSAPVVSITQADAAAILAASKSEGNYATGTMTVYAEDVLIVSDGDYYTMSEFSSWGALGKIQIKPEIVAPGGQIRSVAGYYYDSETGTYAGGHDQYELMSGTSMAAPQITGLSAVLKRYIEENKLSVKGLTDRALAQSLLMSTATPLIDADGNYYSILQQGSGLANINDAMNAGSYITMNSNATVSAADGKVKAELGDDPERTGVYTFSFNLNNTSKSDIKYTLSADVFTQGISLENIGSEEDPYYEAYALNSTMGLDANVKFSFSGQNKKKPNEVTVKKGKSVSVSVSIALTDETKQLLDTYFEKGAYVEAYVFAKANNKTSTLSIPVLAVYGSWTDSSMFDNVSYTEYYYYMTTKVPYLAAETGRGYSNSYTVNYGDGSGERPFGINLFAEEDYDYHPEFASLNNENGDSIKSIQYSLIRNAKNIVVKITNNVTGEVYLNTSLGDQTGAFYYINELKWYNKSRSINLNWKGTDANGNKLPEGTSVKIDLIAVPEYYCDADGNFDESKLGEGAYFSTNVVIDNTAPEVEVFELEGYGDVFYAVDNLAIAALKVYKADRSELLLAGAIDEAEFALPFEYFENFDLDEGVYLVDFIDYAGNVSTYRMFYGIDPAYEVESIELNQSAITLLKNNSYTLTAFVSPENIFDDRVIWTSSDESVATVNANGRVTAVGVGECVITATSAFDAEKSASCDVSVMEISADLNAVVWDEYGEVWFSEFNTADLPNYTKLTEESTDAAINNVVVSADGNIYASDLDTSSGVSVLYTVDADTFELTEIGESSICYTDMADAPNLGVLIATYFNYIVLVDKETGDYLGAFNYLSDGDLVGIAYAGSTYNRSYGQYMDCYFLLDDQGNIYEEAFMPYYGSFAYLFGEEDALLGSTGITCDTPYFQSLYCNDEFLFISNFNEADNCVTLYALVLDETGSLFCLGQFEDGVWPIAALCEFTPSAAELSADKVAAFENATISEESVMFNASIQ